MCIYLYLDIQCYICIYNMRVQEYHMYHSFRYTHVLTSRKRQLKET